jgi:drug/metabolite transporter (DMT)-like permease
MKFALGFFLMIFMTSAGAFLIKTGMTQAPAAATHLVALLSLRVWAGVACFGVSALVYMWLVRWLPLYVVQSIGAAQFIATILVASMLLDERILPWQWLGITLIVAGILLVAWASS